MAISQAHLILLFLLSLFFLPTFRAVPFYYCGDGSSPIEVTNVEIINKGLLASIKISGFTSTNIKGADVGLNVKLGVIRVLRKVYDLCELMACPVAPGYFVLSIENVVPSDAALLQKCKFHIEIIEESDDREEEIMCLDFPSEKSAVVSA